MFTKLNFLLIILFLAFQNTDSEYLQTQVLEARQLYPYRAYKDAQIFHYIVPPQVSLATFQYKANGSFHCAPKAVAVYVQYGSYPVMSPQNASFPESFVIHRLFLHNITLYTDLVPVSLNVTNPLPGSWYAAAFLLETNERIAQKGLFTPCSGWLSSTVRLNISKDVKTILPMSTTLQEVTGTQIYRFFSSSDTWSCEVKLKNCQPNISNKCSAVVSARPVGFPFLEPVNNTELVNCTEVKECELTFIPAVDQWNYILVQSLTPGKLKFDLTVETKACQKQHVRQTRSINASFDNEIDELINVTEVIAFSDFEKSCWPDVPLIRISLASSLAFEYNLPPEDEETYPLILNITNDSPTVTSFEVLPAIDIGGTLVVEMAVSPFTNNSLNNISVVGCLAYGVRPKVPRDASCDTGIYLLANTSSWESRLSTAFIPFPEAGTWYFSLIPHCFTEEESENNEMLSIPCESTTTSVFLRIRSAPCILGQCGNYGTCYQYVSSGFIFSTCNCIAGWQGWGCTDGTQAHSDVELLLDVLFLTLSNLLFIPAIVLGIYRKFFTEAFVYFATMFFSSFYHACDAEVYSYCLIRLSVLQFCDFYSAILSIWVTLIAMANLPPPAQSFIHMVGAIGVALGVEYDRTGLWVIVVPAGIGILILIASWVTHCCKKNICYPSKKTWLIGLIPGVILATCGLVIYAFFETKDNYPYVHSAWHGTIALSVLFLLPRRSAKNKV